ncbi:hypothetical protein [Streptomyces antarcticus]|uniref:hypothetical protein n=1 Tax=Streptomyces antarcticus TaxID=2996458 RepID=UPI00226DEC8F|nr:MULTISPECIES: hypothetical protein [unclassified Streptomyces]MCY0941891.1 hypothetical protein [Streptomyces sp. H34-AA3]MCZ4082836.1 hypothetical protein [Streptomyces sp. H34-S5]
MTAVTIPSLTKKDTLAALKEVVKESPDTVYRAPEHMDPEGTGMCFYVHVDESGAPTGAGCVVGKVLHRLGVPLDTLRKVERLSASGAFNYFGQDGDSRLSTQLTEVQYRQDQGATWEAAYTAVFGKLR